MIRGTTPTHTFTLPFDTSLIRSVHIYYSQNGKLVLTKTREDATLSGKSVEVRLTQEDTLKFSNGVKVEMQLHILTTGGDAIASRIMTTMAERLLANEVIK